MAVLGSTTSPPLIYIRPSLFHRILFFLQVWAIKIISTFGFIFVRKILKPTPIHLLPTLIIAYPSRPHLHHRIFIPRSYKPGQLLPLYLDSHGGGFTFCDAAFDDEFCANFANKYHVVVASIEYGTAPRNRFPGPLYDVIAASLAILNDESLPIDKTKVVLGGFSAGGNLSIAAAQSLALRSKIHGVIAWYPVTDVALLPAEKQATRAYRNAKDLDVLKDIGPALNWAYIPPGHDLRDPLISVRWAEREDLPKYVFVVGAEYDMLCKEARDMIFDLAGLDDLERKEGMLGFEKDGYKWYLARDVMHGFTHDLLDGIESQKISKGEYVKAVEEVGEWLFKGPWSVYVNSPTNDGSKISEHFSNGIVTRNGGKKSFL